MSRLDRTERRYAWFKRQLRAKEEVWQLFPPSWRVPKMLCMYFCKITRAHLSMILDNSSEKDQGEGAVRVLLEVRTPTVTRRGGRKKGGGGTPRATTERAWGGRSFALHPLG